MSDYTVIREHYLGRDLCVLEVEESGRRITTVACRSMRTIPPKWEYGPSWPTHLRILPEEPCFVVIQ